ncbi:MAG: suppressor of fused domain protein [Mycobacterium sp.]|nr:suppressor of fused domain protein [Mycobacterium sp.]
MVDVLGAVRAQLTEYFAEHGSTGEPVGASVTFLGADTIEVLRYGPAADGVYHYASQGCSRYPMMDPLAMVADTVSGPRAEAVLSLRGPTPTGLARSLAVLVSAPAVEGLILEPDALIDLQEPVWQGAAFTAFLLGASDIGDVVLPEPYQPVRILTATPITATEAAWVRLKGAQAMRDAWQQDGVDVLDQQRRAAEPS